jgi:hypothetical protein
MMPSCPVSLNMAYLFLHMEDRWPMPPHIGPGR